MRPLLLLAALGTIACSREKVVARDHDGLALEFIHEKGFHGTVWGVYDYVRVNGSFRALHYTHCHAPDPMVRGDGTRSRFAWRCDANAQWQLVYVTDDLVLLPAKTDALGAGKEPDWGAAPPAFRDAAKEIVAANVPTHYTYEAFAADGEETLVNLLVAARTIEDLQFDERAEKLGPKARARLAIALAPHLAEKGIDRPAKCHAVRFLGAEDPGVREHAREMLEEIFAVDDAAEEKGCMQFWQLDALASALRSDPAISSIACRWVLRRSFLFPDGRPRPHAVTLLRTLVRSTDACPAIGKRLERDICTAPVKCGDHVCRATELGDAADELAKHLFDAEQRSDDARVFMRALLAVGYARGNVPTDIGAHCKP